MPRPDECFNCIHLITHEKITSVMNKYTGTYERAVWYDCDARKIPLPTISKHDCPCAYFQRKQEER